MLLLKKITKDKLPFNLALAERAQIERQQYPLQQVFERGVGVGDQTDRDVLVQMIKKREFDVRDVKKEPAYPKIT